jgi:hypothetical protein
MKDGETLGYVLAGRDPGGVDADQLSPFTSQE